MSEIKFKCIVADPPWPYDAAHALPVREELTHNRFEGGVSSVERYGGMTIQEICNLKPSAEPDSHCYIWTTNSFLEEAHTVARAWGFKPKTLLTWGKIKSDGTPSMKSGYYFRGATEHCLFCVRGKLRLAGPCKPTLYLSERLPHSVKPEWFYKLCEEVSPGPYLELFARKKREGWTQWGNEIEGVASIESSPLEIKPDTIPTTSHAGYSQHSML